MNCGNCLMTTVEIVELEDGLCPKCGADYRSDEQKLFEARQAASEIRAERRNEYALEGVDNYPLDGPGLDRLLDDVLESSALPPDFADNDWDGLS